MPFKIFGIKTKEKAGAKHRRIAAEKLEEIREHQKNSEPGLRTATPAEECLPPKMESILAPRRILRRVRTRFFGKGDENRVENHRNRAENEEGFSQQSEHEITALPPMGRGLGAETGEIDKSK